MKKKIILALICVVILAVALTACNEKTKQDRIDGDYSDKTVTSNGGLAVRYGKYLYYINGYAGETADNTFGEVVKGSIVRAELDSNNLPKADTKTVIIPKNVYYSSSYSSTAGIYIYNDYIYYASTSVKKDGEGNPKTGEMVVMRTKVDGTGTQTVAEFKDHSTPFRVVGNTLIYIRENKIVKINLAEKKFPETVIAESIGTTYFFTNGAKPSDNYLVYTVTEDKATVVKAVEIDGSNEPKTLLSNSMIGGNLTYTITLMKVVQRESGISVFYKITDTSPNAPSLGIYYYNYDKNFSFTRANLVRLTQNDSTTVGLNYSDFYFINGRIFAVATKTVDSETYSKIDILSETGAFEEEAIAFKASVTVDSVYMTDDGVYCYYTESSKFYRIQIIEIDEDGAMEKVEKNTVLCYDGAFSSSGYASMEIIGSVLYFWNSNVSDNIYYLNLAAITERGEAVKAVPLAIFTDEDRIKAF